MATKNEYNGWYNYETWLANLWMENDAGEYERWREDAQTLLNEASEDADDEAEARETAVQQLAERLEADMDERIDEMQLTGLASDLLNAAASEIYWREIARHRIDDADYNPAESDDASEGDEIEDECAEGNDPDA
jgi:hypothetical protein